METVNILIAVDGDSLNTSVKNGTLPEGSKAQPTSLGAWQQSDVFISMVAQNSFATNDQGKSELTINAESGSLIQWTITTFDNNADYTAYLYNGNFNPSNAISGLEFDAITADNYLPGEGNPTGPVTMATNSLYTTSARLLKPNTQIQYTMSFALIDNATGNPVGYFSWDPFIQVQG